MGPCAGDRPAPHMLTGRHGRPCRSSSNKRCVPRAQEETSAFTLEDPPADPPCQTESGRWRGDRYAHRIKEWCWTLKRNCSGQGALPGGTCPDRQKSIGKKPHVCYLLAAGFCRWRLRVGRQFPALWLAATSIRDLSRAWTARWKGNRGHADGYGDDYWTARADSIRACSQPDCEVVFYSFNVHPPPIRWRWPASARHTIAYLVGWPCRKRRCGGARVFSKGSKAAYRTDADGKLTTEGPAAILAPRQAARRLSFSHKPAPWPSRSGLRRPSL